MAKTRLVHKFSPSRIPQLLSNEHCRTARVKRLGVVCNLIEYLEALQAKTVVVESDYVDRDYLEDYASFYVRCFTRYSHSCRRLHFFSKQFNERVLKRLVSGNITVADLEAIRGSYLGFIVVRPLPDALIGRTVLRPPARGEFQATRSYECNLFGFDLKVKALAFQEQDSVLAACATVALWSSLHQTQELFKSAAPTPSEITRIANQTLHRSRPIPTHGLAIQQICNVVRQSGLEAEVFDIEANPRLPLASLMYAYLQYGLPIYLAVYITGYGSRGELPNNGYHAVTVVGHSNLGEQNDFPEDIGTPESERVPRTGRRIKAFYAHDDQHGPYSELLAKELEGDPRIKGDPREKYPMKFEGRWLTPAGKAAPIYPYVVIVPLYNKIRVTFLDIQDYVMRLDWTIGQQYSRSAVEWDCRLIKLGDFRNLYRNELALDRQTRMDLLFDNGPRFIWCVSLKWYEAPVFDLIFDATDMARSSLRKIIWYNKDVKDNIREYVVQMTPKDILKMGRNLRRFLLTHSS
jgi:hypothetical protein